MKGSAFTDDPSPAKAVIPLLVANWSGSSLPKAGALPSNASDALNGSELYTRPPSKAAEDVLGSATGGNRDGGRNGGTGTPWDTNCTMCTARLNSRLSRTPRSLRSARFL